MGERVKKNSLVGMESTALREKIVAMGVPAYRAEQIKKGLYERSVRTWEGLHDVPKALRESLAEEYTLAPCTLREERSAPDGTVKYLLDLPDDEVIEAVFLPYNSRTTVCISSQVGCAMACTFCATGTEGLSRNLTTGEIVDQILFIQAANPDRRISNVVLMGMGEPLLNYDNVIASIKLMHEEIGLSLRHITLSTVGVVPAIYRLAKEEMPITLAVSLHAPTDALRSELVPLNDKYPIAKLLNACVDYVETTKRRMTFEYVLMAGVNDTEKEAHELGAMLKKMPLCSVNTIPYNSTDVAAPYKRPTPEATRKFRDIVASYGVTITQRFEKGHNIAAACGQLKRSALSMGKIIKRLPMAEMAGESSEALSEEVETE
jgi:23S rRNA (adenine2503-C2)-methyltransferase